MESNMLKRSSIAATGRNKKNLVELLVLLKLQMKYLLDYL